MIADELLVGVFDKSRVNEKKGDSSGLVISLNFNLHCPNYALPLEYQNLREVV